jgi:hypothetical protein
MSVHALPDRRPGGALPNQEASGPDGRSPSAPSRSALVTDFLAIAALDPAVEGLRAPATAATFVVGPFELDHVADFELTRDGETVLVDVATDAELARHPLRTPLVAGPVQATDGRSFAVETARTLRAEPRFSTVRLIGSCRRIPVSAGDRVRILHHLDEAGTAPLVEVAGAAQAYDGVAAVLALACEGLVTVEIDRPILPETRVRRRKLAYADPFGF